VIGDRRPDHTTAHNHDVQHTTTVAVHLALQ
jgi:hypothetical protein